MKSVLSSPFCRLDHGGLERLDSHIDQCGVNGPGVLLSVRKFGPPSLQVQAVEILRRIKCSLTELPVERRAALET